MIDWRDNPIMRRELLLRLRPLPSQRLTLAIVAILGLLAVGLLYWAALEGFRVRNAPREVLILTIVLQTLMTVGIAPAATANAVSREREQRTWDLLVVSLLKPHEVVLGKLIGRTIPVLLLLMLGLPMMLLCILSEPELLLGALLGTLCVLATLLLYSTGGLVASCFSRKTVTATAISYLFAGGWVVGTLILWGLTTLIFPSISTQEATFWLAVNPLAVIEPTMVKYTPASYSSDTSPLYALSPWALLVVYSGLTVVLLWILVSTYRHWAYRQ
ncbi:MAG: hypothetical protein RMK92_03525 [Armatimonadota bacterium]|nr:hypothetical protein [Armatimonadota bacterium]MDW8104061.1 hypothetical protein [Armatimonadota bacterium]